MKVINFLTLFPVLFIQPSVAQEIHVYTDFDHGSIGSLKQISEKGFKGQTMHWIKRDKIGNQYYWFYFMITGVKNKALSFELGNLTGTYRNNPMDQFTDYTWPVLSYDNAQWARISDVNYDDEDKVFRFNARFIKDTAWIAYAHPYSYWQSQAYLDTILKNQYVRTRKQGFSDGGRQVNLLEITNRQTEGKKKNVLITALQHAGEDCGGYFIEGFINFLISEDESARQLRNDFVFFMVPMVNPDGIFHGITRYNANMEDLNSEWDDDVSDTMNLPTEREVLFVKNWVHDFYRSRGRIDLFVDVHSQSQKWTNNVLWSDNDKLRELVSMTHNTSWKYLRTDDENDGSSRWYFSTQMHTLSATVELTQSYSGDRHYLDLDDYRGYGKSFALAIEQYFYGR